MKYILIDDDPIINLVHKKIIKNADLEAEITDFISGKKALEFFKQKANEQVDVVLLDINMPEMNGFEFLEELIKNKNIDCAKWNIFILTSSLNIKDKEQAEKYPILKGYLEKPLNVAKMMQLNHH